VRGVAYSTAEKELLAQIFPTAAKEDLLAAFTGRTLAGLEAEARVLRIRRNAPGPRARHQVAHQEFVVRVQGIEPPQPEVSIVQSALANRRPLEVFWMGIPG
jgi:hypothetical protein